jgi:hypothetical protein
MYKTENYGVFLGLMTMPFGNEDDFLKYEIENLFEQYKENVKRNLVNDLPADSDFEQYLYRPKAYCLFGNFDLAVFSLVDDFSLGTRNFHPFSPLIKPKRDELNKDYQPQNFTFHIISGTAPDMRYIDPKEPSLIEKSKDTFLASAPSEYPLIGITSIKLNNGFLVGGGGRFVDLVLRKIREVIREKSPLEGNLEYMILHSFSWHEITLVFFSNSYRLIAHKILQIRELTFGDLRTSDNEKSCQKVMDASLLYLMRQKETGNAPKPEEIDQSHTIVHTHTTFGYDANLLLNDAPEQMEMIREDEINFYIRWNIKPGHLYSFIQDLEKELNQKNKNTEALKLLEGKITAGRGDYSYVINKNALKEYRSIVNLVIESNLIKHVRKINTIPELTSDFRFPGRNYFAVDDHFLLHSKLSQFRFKLEQVAEVRSLLKELRVSKILREKVTNMFVIFNDGIHDPILYGYFIELKPFLEEVIALLESLGQEKSQTVDYVSTLLDKITTVFETGYKNRFGQSYIMNEITDFNIDFNGGIQQLLVAYDGAYKSLTSLLGEQGRGRSIAYVSGHSNIESDILNVRLNYFHLYQPEFFAAAATHEAANFFFDRDSQLKQIHDSLLHYLEENDDQYIKESALKYFFTDVATYHLAFAGDFDLFFYWHWCSFLQTGLTYNLDGTFNQEFFNRFMARMFLVETYLGKSKLNQSLLPPFQTHSAAVYKAWERAHWEAKPLAQELLDEHPDYIDMIRAFVLGLLIYEFVEDAGKAKDEEESEQLLKQVESTILEDSGVAVHIMREYLNHESDELRDASVGKRNLREFIRFSRKSFMDLLAEEVIEHFQKVFGLSW